MSQMPAHMTPDSSDAPLHGERGTPNGKRDPREEMKKGRIQSDEAHAAGAWNAPGAQDADEDLVDDEDDELIASLSASDDLSEAELLAEEVMRAEDIASQISDLNMEVYDIAEEAPRDGYTPVTINTSRGEIACRFYSAPQATRAVIWVGGVGGGFDSPANDLYARLSSDLVARGISSLRLRYRQPTDLEECVLDVLAGLGVLESEGIERLALVGHSLGGAVVIQAGTASDAVRGVVTLATQSYGASDVVDELPEDCALFLAHGMADTVLPPESSEYVYSLAHEPRTLLLFEDAGHGLDEVSDQLTRSVREFLLARLGA